MANPLSDCKKVRGWRRQIARVEEWSRQVSAMDIDSVLQERGRVHAKIQIDPWNRLVRRVPPAWLRRLIVDGFFRIFDAWNAQLGPKARTAYLKIWLVHPRFMESRVVAAVDSWADFSSSFHPKVPPLRRFPSELGIGDPPLFARLNWLAHADEEVVDEEVVDEEMLVTASKEVVTIRYGDTWIGGRGTA